MISLKGLNSASRVFLLTGILLLPLSLIEFLFGFNYGSYILLADSYHGFIDSSSAFFYSIVLKTIYKRSRRFPAGKYNLESIGILVASIIVLFLSLNLLVNVYRSSIASYSSPWFATLTWISGLATLVIFVMEKRYNWIGLVRADMSHSKLDISIEVVSGFAIILNQHFITLTVVLVIVGFVIFDTARELKEAVMSLVGASLESPIKEAVLKKAMEMGVNVLSTSVRRVGSFYAVSLIIGLPSDMTLREAYSVRKRVYKAINSIDSIAIIEIKTVPLSNLKLGEMRHGRLESS